MNPTQLQTFADDIVANTNPVIVQARTDGNNNAVVAWYNGPADPAFYLWRIAMSIAEMKGEHFDWIEVVALNTADLLALQVLTDQEFVDPSKTSIRGAFNEIFKTSNTTKAALAAGAKRLATEIQKLLADTSGGDGSEGTPATATVESVSLQDVRDARELNPW